MDRSSLNLKPQLEAPSLLRHIEKKSRVFKVMDGSSEPLGEVKIETKVQANLLGHLGLL